MLKIFCRKPKGNTTKLSLASVISFATNSLLSKKLRTSLSVVASSVGILGVALILSLTNGVSKYIKSVEAETVSSAPVTISAFGRTESKTAKPQTQSKTAKQTTPQTKQQTENATTKQQITPQIKPQTNPNTVLPTDGNNTAYNNYFNLITEEYLAHIDNIDASLVTSIDYIYGLETHMFAKNAEGEIALLAEAEIKWQQLKPNASDGFKLLTGECPIGANQ
ncbi:MAG: hypothetical protein RSB59_02790, partial [Clostridia bacterium]